MGLLRSSPASCLSIRRISKWYTRDLYEPRGGVRDVEDLKKEQAEKMLNTKENPMDYTIFGNKRKTPKELLFYSDRKGGAGYSCYSSNIYSDRPYLWPPFRKVMTGFIVALMAIGIIAVVDFKWFVNYAKYLYACYKRRE